MSAVAYQQLLRWFLLGVLSLLLLGGRLAFAGQSPAEVGAMLKAMADPAGAPFYPVVMQVLQVLTWALHILFVWTSVGGLFYAIYGMTRQDENRRRLGKAMLELAKVSVSLAIVLGVAPLLFYQVIYDPLWYSSATLSGSWYVAFIVLLLVGYYFIWGAYFTRNRPGLSALLSVAGVFFLLFVGFIIHVVNYQALYPEKWVQWYTSGGTAMNHEGWNIYAFNLFRYLALLVFPSVSATGIFMMLYAWYFGQRKAEFSEDYVKFSANTGVKWALYGGAGWIISHILYILTIPADWGAKTHPLTILSVIGLLLCAGVLYMAQKDPVRMAIPSLAMGAVATLLVAVFREYLRVASTARFGYSIYEYKLNLEWLSPVLFIGTLIVGLINYAFIWGMAFRVGTTPRGEVYTANAFESKLGTYALVSIVLWAVVFILAGLFVVFRNYL